MNKIQKKVTIKRAVEQAGIVVHLVNEIEILRIISYFFSNITFEKM